MKFELFTKENCSGCVTLKAQLGLDLLQLVNVRNIDEDKAGREFIVSKGVRTVPACFVDDEQVPSRAFRDLLENQAAATSN